MAIEKTPLKKRTYKGLKIAGVSILFVCILAIGGFFLWTNHYYHAEDVAIAVMNGNSSTTVNDNLTILLPDISNKTGIIFYPGAKVEAISYLLILEKLKNQGFTCVLVEMPFNMAIFDVYAADEVFEKLPEINDWYIAGHSMGGAMASNYASHNPDKIKGLLLLGAYIYGDYPPQKTLTIYGTLNDNLEKNINYTDNIVKIEGGNHAQFGNYGKQKGDPDATITAEEQQNIAVEAICDFIYKMS